MGVVSETDITGTSQIVKFLFHYYFTIWAVSQTPSHNAEFWETFLKLRVGARSKTANHHHDDFEPLFLGVFEDRKPKPFLSDYLVEGISDTVLGINDILQ